MLSHWAYQSLKKHPHMRRVIDRYKDEVVNQTFEYLFNGVARTIRESQHDANAQSIRDDLRKGPKHSKQDSKDNKTSAAAASPKGPGKGKEKKSNPSQPSNPKGGKGQSKESKEGAKAKGKASPPKGKSSVPNPGGNPPVCIFHARGKCTRANCPFLHTTPAQAASTTQAVPKVPSPKAKVAAMVALAGLGPVCGLTTHVESGSGFLDFIGDTGAGECLGSPEALKRQGVSLPDHFFSESSQPLKFTTGGGLQSGTSTVGCWSEEFTRMLNLYMLPQCPLALSIGQLCNDGFSFVWPTHGVPFLVPPSSSLSYQVDGPTFEADRVDHNVPVFRISTDFVPGLPCAPSGGGYAAALPSEDPKDAKEPGESGELEPEVAAPEEPGDRGEDDGELEDVPLRYLGDGGDDPKDGHSVALKFSEEELDDLVREFDEPIKPKEFTKVGDTSPAFDAGGSKAKVRGRKITPVRIGTYGPTKGCQACQDLTYNHTKECRKRFNELLDAAEPVKARSSPSTPAPGPAPSTPAHPPEVPNEESKEPMAEDLDDVDSGYEPSIAPEEDPGRMFWGR
eukprot:Skav230560  [mRNA]  locus=scaffold2372:3218:5805:- [translate_table: standard]